MIAQIIEKSRKMTENEENCRKILENFKEIKKGYYIALELVRENLCMLIAL